MIAAARPAHEVSRASTKSPPCSNGGCWGLSRAASSTNISTTTSTNSPSASIGVDHRPEAACSTASSAGGGQRTGHLPLATSTQLSATPNTARRRRHPPSSRTPDPQEPSPGHPPQGRGSSKLRAPKPCKLAETEIGQILDGLDGRALPEESQPDRAGPVRHRLLPRELTERILQTNLPLLKPTPRNITDDSVED